MGCCDAVPQPPARPRADPPAVAEGLSAARTSRRSPSTCRPSWRWAAPRRSSPPRPWACAACWPSTARRRRTARCLDVKGSGDLQPKLNALSKTGYVMAMIDLVDEAMVDTLAVRSTPRSARPSSSAASVTWPTGSAATPRGTTPRSTMSPPSPPRSGNSLSHDYRHAHIQAGQ